MSAKERNIVVYELDSVNPLQLTEEQKQELQDLAEMPDSAIDYSDIPEIADFSNFHRVTPRSSFVRIDGDILEWINTLGEDRQQLINAILRRQMTAANLSNL